MPLWSAMFILLSQDKPHDSEFTLAHHVFTHWSNLNRPYSCLKIQSCALKSILHPFYSSFGTVHAKSCLKQARLPTSMKALVQKSNLFWIIHKTTCTRKSNIGHSKIKRIVGWIGIKKMGPNFFNILVPCRFKSHDVWLECANSASFTSSELAIIGLQHRLATSWVLVLSSPCPRPWFLWERTPALLK